MFRFANIEFVYLFIAIPVLIGAYIGYTYYKRRQIRSFGDPELVAALMPNASRIRPIIKFSLLLVAFVLLIFAAMRPQTGINKTEDTQQGIEIMIALDLSKSMWADDVKPSRLERAKQMVGKVLDNLNHDRVGLVIFAGDAYIQLPITADYTLAKKFVKDLSPNLIRYQGTDIGKALGQCILGFGNNQSDVGRAIILITDAEDHEEQALTYAQMAKEAGINIMVVGVGTPEGTTIQVPGTNGYLKDKEGNIVVTKLNEEVCQLVAQAGEGVYVRCDNTNAALQTVQEQLSQLKTMEVKGLTYTDYEEQFQSFVIAALALLFVEFFIFGRKNKLMTKMDLFGEMKGEQA